VPDKVTPAMRELLAWLARKGMLDREQLRGGDLVNYYHERANAADRAEDERRGRPRRHDYHFTAGSGRAHAWRRTGGRLLSNMQKAGLTIYTGSSWGTALYKLTDEAKRIAREEAGS
jgi:hypothetical protein